MVVTRVHPAPATAIDFEEASSRDVLLDWYRPVSPNTVRVNLISSISGGVGGSDGTSHSLSSAIDRRILGVIRELSDVVLVGARSVRREGYTVPRTARLAIVTSSGDLTGHALDEDVTAGKVLVLTTASSVDRARATVPGNVDIVPLPDTGGALAVADVISALRERGLGHIVCEGGPALAGQLLDAGLVNEICLSTSPLVSGRTAPSLSSAVAVERPARLRQLLLDGASGLYALWSLG